MAKPYPDGPLNPDANCAYCRLAYICHVWRGLQGPIRDAKVLTVADGLEGQSPVSFGLGEHVLLLGIGKAVAEWCETYEGIE